MSVIHSTAIFDVLKEAISGCGTDTVFYDKLVKNKKTERFILILALPYLIHLK